jgi:hypothetical protein
MHVANDALRRGDLAGELMLYGMAGFVLWDVSVRRLRLTKITCLSVEG